MVLFPSGHLRPMENSHLGSVMEEEEVSGLKS